MRESTYLQMRTEMWKIEELDYACNCVMESNSNDYYDYGHSDEYGDGEITGSPDYLIYEAEYVLDTFYEPDHIRNEWLTDPEPSQRKSAKMEIRKIKRWIKKWKSKSRI